MSNCGNCNTTFKFIDVLKGLNPAKVKCSGCDKFIESSYFVLVLAVALFAVLSLAFWFSPFSNKDLTGAPMLAFLAVLGLVFEYGYFALLKSGIIRSNLTKNA